MRILIVSAIIVIAGVVANAQKVQVGVDRTVDLTKYKTYAWTGEKATANPIIHQQIVDAVDRAMAAKGLTKVQLDPQMIVTAVAAVDHDMHMSYPSWSPALNSINTGVVANAQSWPITKGMLVVDISDSKTKNNLWRGTATDTLSHGPSGDFARDAQNVEKNIKKAVDKMFKKYPYGNK
jgi:Domain of unknown function (DUF4136)